METGVSSKVIDQNQITESRATEAVPLYAPAMLRDVYEYPREDHGKGFIYPAIRIYVRDIISALTRFPPI